MVVDADRVVAEALEARDEPVRKVVVREVRREAEVDAVEPLRASRQLLELEVPAHVAYPSVLAGGRVGEPGLGEIKRASLEDIAMLHKRNPVGTRLYHVQTLVCGRHGFG